MRYDICVYDLETTSADPYTCQPIQIAAAMIDGRTLEIKDGGKFESMMSIIPDKKVDEYGLRPVEQDALDVNHKTIEEIMEAPSPKLVMQQFAEWVNSHNYKNDRWSAPIRCGFNSHSFDDVILDRLMGGHLNSKIVLAEKLLPKTKQRAMSDAELAEAYKSLKKLKEPWGFGPWNDARNQQALFNPRFNVDLMQWSFLWHESNRDIRSHSMDSYRDYYGMPREGAHDAMVDVLHEAELAIRFFRLHREIFPDVKFEGACKDGMLVK